jgi:hypothetical protein
MLALLQEGDLFGEGCLETGTRTSTATPIGQSSITRLEKQSLGASLTCRIERVGSGLRRNPRLIR